MARAISSRLPLTGSSGGKVGRGRLRRRSSTTAGGRRRAPLRHWPACPNFNSLAGFERRAEDYREINVGIFMRHHLLFAAVCALGLAALPVRAADTAQQSAMKSCAATWKTMSAADKAKTKYTDYMGTCMKTPSKPSTAAAAPISARRRRGSRSRWGSWR